MIGFNPRSFVVFFTLLVTILLTQTVIAAGLRWTKQASVSGKLNHKLESANGHEAIPKAQILTDDTITPTLYLPFVQGPIESEPDWLAYLNRFRDQANLHHLSENSDWSWGGWLHSRYMVKNDYIGHSEDRGNPWYTVEGDAAAKNGNVFVSSLNSSSDERAIDFWMSGPFHAIGIIDPELYTTGFGSYREEIGLWQFGATLDVSRGRASAPQDISFPIPFPRDGGHTWILQYWGNEFPDPIDSCAGYIPPTGSPIMLQLGPGNVTPNVTDHQLSSNNQLLESCVFDETSYMSPDGTMQSIGRLVLNSRDAVVIIPRQPLVPGQTYTVSISTDTLTTEWSFTAVGSPGLSKPVYLEQFEIR